MGDPPRPDDPTPDEERRAEGPQLGTGRALVDVAYPTEAERIRRASLLGLGLGALLLFLARRPR